MITRPIPDEAMKAVEVVRRAVPLPSSMPKSSRLDGTYLTWDGKCPLGLIPGATRRLPLSDLDFPASVGLRSWWIESFAAWWDRQTDAQAAVEAVWGVG